MNLANKYTYAILKLVLCGKNFIKFWEGILKRHVENMMVCTTKDDGLLFVVSGPSGVGKGVVCARLRRRMPELAYSISATTRTKRTGEEEGREYFFKGHAEFQEMIQAGQLLEWAQYVDNYYGTPRDFVEEQMAQGKNVLLEIDVRGALEVKQKLPQGVFIFLLPPTMVDLENRLRLRGSETEQTLYRRMLTAAEEISQVHNYDYVVVNDRIAVACSKVEAIITAERCRKDRIVVIEEE
ncbi:MAG: hypothetical protein RLZ12_1056 [Bacillota bacterium]|jgi:guanylate kinase